MAAQILTVCLTIFRTFIFLAFQRGSMYLAQTVAELIPDSCEAQRRIRGAKRVGMEGHGEDRSHGGVQRAFLICRAAQANGPAPQLGDKGVAKVWIQLSARHSCLQSHLDRGTLGASGVHMRVRTILGVGHWIHWSLQHGVLSGVGSRGR
jgi:hypothetical protein